MLHLDDVTFTDNIFPVWYENVYGPYLAVIKANGVDGLTVTGNHFPGAYDIFQPSSAGNTSVIECGNTYGVGGTSKDGTCWKGGDWGRPHHGTV